MAPLPPTPKITEINCTLADEFVPFVDGWDQKNCPVEVEVGDFYATVLFKGENLTVDWLSHAVKGAYRDNSDIIETTIGDIVDYEDGRFSVDIYFNAVFEEGETVKFEVDGVQSAWMSLYKAN